MHPVKDLCIICHGYLMPWGLDEISQGENTEQGQGSQAFMEQQGLESTPETQREWPEKSSRCR